MKTIQLSIRLYGSILLVAATLFLGCWTVAAQTTQYERFTEPQKRLFAGLAARIDAEKKLRKAPSVRFGELSSSDRATFAAVTNALVNTELTDSQGASLGSAIDIVTQIGLIAGDRPGKRSDQKFRLYVHLRKDAILILERSLEFKRGKDNTIYHKGYPINFRQLGSTPTLQFSISKDGSKADIDVDYRSSGFPAALFNGHLTAANSDVRAPGNYLMHVLRWTGLLDFWTPDLDASIARFASQKLRPLRSDSLNRVQKDGMSETQAVTATAREFLDLWLIRRDPDRAVNFVGSSFLVCRQGPIPVDPRFEMRLRRMFYNILRAANKGLRKPKQVSKVIEPFAQRKSWMSPVLLPESDFALSSVRGDDVSAFVCRESKPSASGSTDITGKFYTTTFQFVTTQEKKSVISLLWGMDGGMWRIRAFDAFAY